MFYGELDARTPLPEGSLLEFPGRVYGIDRFLGAGGFALAYLAHEEGSSHYVVVKELFPRRVERGVAERREDGRIVIYDPAREGPHAERPDAWEELLPLLTHEVEMTRRAAAVFQADGSEDRQNNPDVFDVGGPFRDRRGNAYLILRTAQGEPLSKLIRAGFVKNEAGKTVTNGNLPEILELLAKLAQRLSRLHGDHELLHLDLSPENIYVTRTGGGTELTPVLIDYGSAYDRAAPRGAGGHSFTCNPFSAPEIAALADLNDEEAGYAPDESSDTYSVVSILFYALTGRLFSPRMLFNPSWKRDFRQEYLYAGDGGSAAQSFASGLIALVEKGLAPDQKRRFRTANELFLALQELRRAYRKTGILLNLMEKDELISYAALDQYPLYDYRSDSGDLDVLCLGSGVFARRMILSLLSCGQMLDAPLHIHIVSEEDRQSFAASLLRAAPMLEEVSDLTGREPPEELRCVRFSYTKLADLSEPAQSERIAAQYAFCRYVIVSLGRNSANIDLARRWGKSLSRLRPEGDRPVRILYYAAEDAAANVRSHVDTAEIAPWIALTPVGETLRAYAALIRSLGRRALRLSCLYERLADPRAALEDLAGAFLADPYGQRSSCASALHLKYKLASLGLRFDEDADRQTFIPACRALLQGERRKDLLWLEHRRWMMYMIADGYRRPSPEALDACSFRGANASFRDAERKLHPCLVPAERTGIVLARLPRSEWDRYESDAEIDATAYDELDKVSLKLHLLARKKARESRLLADLREGVGAALEKALTARASLPETHPERLRLAQLRGQYDALLRSLETLAQNGVCSGEPAQLDRLEAAFREAGVEASAAFSAVRGDLKPFLAFSRYYDYKEPDAAIVDHLLWLLYADEDLTLLKLGGQTLADDVAAPIRLRPKTLVYWGGGSRDEKRLTAFLRSQGNRGTVSFAAPAGAGQEALTKELRALIRQTAGEGRCVVDLTGADPLLTEAALSLADSEPGLGVIRCSRADGAPENLRGFPEAEIYRLPFRISAEELWGLLGAEDAPDRSPELRELRAAAPALWDFSRRFRADREAIAAFFAAKGAGSAELRIACSDADFRPFRTMIDQAGWRGTALDRCFARLETLGLVKELRAAPLGGGISLSFRAPAPALEALGDFFNRKRWFARGPFALKSGRDGGGLWAELCSGYSVELEGGFSDRLLPALRQLQELGLIYALETAPPSAGAGGSLRFAYAGRAVRACLMRAENLPTLFAWDAALQTGYFDDCRPFFSLPGGEERPAEPNLLLTKGLCALVVACRTAPFPPEQLQALGALARRFSAGSRAVLLCSLSREAEREAAALSGADSLQAAAEAQGLFFLNLDETAPERLGPLLIRITEGKA